LAAVGQLGYQQTIPTLPHFTLHIRSYKDFSQLWRLEGYLACGRRQWLL